MSGTAGTDERVNINRENDGGIFVGKPHEPICKGALLETNNSPDTVIPKLSAKPFQLQKYTVLKVCWLKYR